MLSIPKSIRQQVINEVDANLSKYLFLDKYLELKNKNLNAIKLEMEQKKQDFETMLDFVDRTFPSGFAKFRDSQGTSRPYFEAIAVGSYLALKEKQNLIVSEIWAETDKSNQIYTFKIPIGRYQTHKPKNMKDRIEYVKNKLLGNLLEDINKYIEQKKYKRSM